MRDHIQLGPSCDLDEHGDPKPPKYARVDRWINDHDPADIVVPAKGQARRSPRRRRASR